MCALARPCTRHTHAHHTLTHARIMRAFPMRRTNFVQGVDNARSTCVAFAVQFGRRLAGHPTRSFTSEFRKGMRTDILDRRFAEMATTSTRSTRARTTRDVPRPTAPEPEISQA